MQMSEIHSFSADQERGVWFELVDPVDGKPCDFHLKIAGPDSETQNKARLTLADDLAAMAGPDGRVSAADREKCRIKSLASCVLDWRIAEGGEAVKFSHAQMVRILSIGHWVQQQVDAFAADRAGHRKAD